MSYLAIPTYCLSKVLFIILVSLSSFTILSVNFLSVRPCNRIVYPKITNYLVYKDTTIEADILKSTLLRLEMSKYAVPTYEGG